MRLWRRNPVGGIEHRYENIVPSTWVGGRWRARGNKKAMRVQIGWVQVQIGPAGIGYVPEPCRVNVWQLIDQPDLQRVALLQRETHPAAVSDCTGSRRTVIAARRSLADLVDPADGIDGGALTDRCLQNGPSRAPAIRAGVSPLTRARALALPVQPGAAEGLRGADPASQKRSPIYSLNHRLRPDQA